VREWKRAFGSDPLFSSSSTCFFIRAGRDDKWRSSSNWLVFSSFKQLTSAHHSADWDSEKNNATIK
jgi:hypothetical protein